MRRGANEVIIYSNSVGQSRLLGQFVGEVPNLQPVAFDGEAGAAAYLVQRREHVAGIIGDLTLLGGHHGREACSSGELFETAQQLPFRQIPFAIISRVSAERLQAMRADDRRIDYVASFENFCTDSFRTWASGLVVRQPSLAEQLVLNLKRTINKPSRPVNQRFRFL